MLCQFKQTEWVCHWLTRQFYKNFLRISGIQVSAFDPLNHELPQLWVGGDPGSGGDGGHDQAQHGDLPGRRVLGQLELSPDEQGGHSGDDGEEEDGQEPSGKTERSINTILGTKNVIKT